MAPLKTKIFFIAGLVLVIGLAFYFTQGDGRVPAPAVEPASNQIASSVKPSVQPFLYPISSPEARMTKKPFGLKVSPRHSPVTPERFSGYHTGVDFEILPGEEDIAVPVFAACDGKLIYRNNVNGYGGVAIQECRIKNEAVTVLYGHLKLSSIASLTKEPIPAGAKIGILGQGYSAETSGERKHLHFSVHKGSKIDLRGYVPSSSDLSGWENPTMLINPL